MAFTALKKLALYNNYLEGTIPQVSLFLYKNLFQFIIIDLGRVYA
jgi:hypothetical protein